MRIGLDVRMYGRSGIGAYVAQLVARLPKYLPKSELVLFGDRSIPLPAKGKRRVKFVRVRAPIYSLAEQIRLPLAASGRGLSIFHCPHYNAPLAIGEHHPVAQPQFPDGIPDVGISPILHPNEHQSQTTIWQCRKGTDQPHEILMRLEISLMKNISST